MRRRILSASRRTDLPGWYPERLARRLSERLERHGPEGIYGVVFWTRFPAALTRPPLRDLVETLRSVAVNLTLTGLGGTRLEPRAPRPDEVLAVLPELIDLLQGDPRRIRWRFDPLIHGASSLRTFGRLAAAFARLGVYTCTFSFPADRSLRGSMIARYRALGVPEWPGEAARRDFIRGMASVAGPLGLELLVCSQPAVHGFHPALRAAQCIPLDVLAGAYPGAPLPELGKDATQRRHCTCPPSEDIGDYRADACRTGCLYCYSCLGGPDAGETLPWFLRRRGSG